MIAPSLKAKLYQSADNCIRIIGPVKPKDLVKRIALPIHRAYYYFRATAPSSCEANFKRLNNMFPMLEEMILVSGRLPRDNTTLADSELLQLDQLRGKEKDSAQKFKDGYVRHQQAGNIGALRIEFRVFNN
jgi:hypothetical protein